MAPASESTIVSPISPTPTSEKGKFTWQRPKLYRSGQSGSNTGTVHRVTFSGSSKNSNKNSSNNVNGEKENSQSSASDSSRPPTPGQNTPTPELWSPLPDNQKRVWQKINRQTEAASEPPLPPASPSEPRPFLVYNDSFLNVLGASPSIKTLIEDTRQPYFYNSGIFCSRTSTLFLASAPIHDPSPSAAPSRNLGSIITKVDFYSPTEFSRDKVRTPEHTYMPASGCAYKSGLVLCAQGTLAEPAALVYMDCKRPHRTYSLLTNYNGVPLNSPHSCVAHPDGSIWFTDPHLSASLSSPQNNIIKDTPSFRPRPKLPPLLYRFDLATSDLRPMASDLTAPTSLAFSPDCRTLYVLDQPAVSPVVSSRSAERNSNGSNSNSNNKTNGHNNSTAIPAPQAQTSTTTIPLPQIHAYTVLTTGPAAAPFLTNKRLFAMPLRSPSSLATDLFGNVYVGCSDGVHVFDMGGCLIGRIVTDGCVTGLCFGRGGELWVSLGSKLGRVQLGREIRAGGLGV